MRAGIDVGFLVVLVGFFFYLGFSLVREGLRGLFWWFCCFGAQGFFGWFGCFVLVFLQRKKW